MLPRTDDIKGKSVFFGHQSVGRNILEGIRLMDPDSSEIAVIRSSDRQDIPEHPNVVHILHNVIGRNTDPMSKISDFQAFMTEDFGGRVDYAIMKFCYVDVYGKNTVEEIYSQYMSTMLELERTFPETTFLYTTMPLTTPYSGWKDRIKKVLGREVSGFQGNMERAQFNERLRNNPDVSGRLFDIAKAEAVSPDGDRVTVRLQNTEYEALVPGYSTDGGHLNDAGKIHLAVKFIKTLDEIED